MDKEKEVANQVAKSDSLTLDQLQIGQSGVVTKVAGEGKIRRRLLDMGLTPGAVVFLRKTAPLGDPIQINLRGFELTLRKVEAQNISIRLLTNKEEAK